MKPDNAFTSGPYWHAHAWYSRLFAETERRYQIERDLHIERMKWLIGTPERDLARWADDGGRA